MDRSDIVLSVLASAAGKSLSPVQLQKALFLLQRNIPHIFSEGQGFNFVPYDYGPFDKAVYDEATRLAMVDLARIDNSPYTGYKEYSATDTGEKRGTELAEQLRPEDADYLQRVVAWVKSLSFAKLVKSIYDAYPDMRVNSVFVD